MPFVIDILIQVSCHLFSPLQVNSGDVKDHTFEPEDHEESLGERTVSDALTITTSLQIQQHIFTYTSPPGISKS